MTNRIDRKFKELKAKRQKAFIAYITTGDPSLAMTAKLVRSLEKSGVDIIELGIPFSDPLADGPTIQAASMRALRRRITLKKAFGMVRKLRPKTGIPIAFMTYYNPILRYGLNRFIDDCKRSGVDGVIVPDLPYEEAGELVRLGLRKGIATINLVAPTSTVKRIREIAKRSTGFIYYVSLTGVTGARKKLSQELKARLKTVRSISPKPICVGFGISTPGQAKEAAKISDGVIVGSAIVKIIETNLSNKKALLLRVERFSKGMEKVIHGA